MTVPHSRGRAAARLAGIGVLLLAVLASIVGATPRVAQANATSLFFSEYIEGSSFNKALEIYNGTGAAVDLAAGQYIVQMYFNGSTSVGLTINLVDAANDIVANGDVFVIAPGTTSSPPPDPAIIAAADLITSSTSWFNGDDAVVLRSGGATGPIVDVIGQIGFDPGTEWGTGLVSTADNTLRRLPNVCAGDTDGSNAFDPAAQWEGFAQNTFGGLGSHTANCAGDTAPSVSSVVPANSATGVAVDANITVTFSEPVNAASDAFGLVCAAPVALAVSGGPTTFTLDPTADLPNSTSCTLTVVAALVTDQDAGDPPDTMAADFVSSFTTVAAGPTITRIHAIQGSGPNVTGLGPFTVEAIVVGDYQTQGSGQLRGFFLQEEDADADSDPATSEGIFVFCGACPVNVAVGDRVRVTGEASDFFGMSQLTATTTGSIQLLSSGSALPSAAAPTLPIPGVPTGDLAAARAFINAYFEQFEGMLVRFNGDLRVAEYFELARYGQLVLAAGDRPRQFTDIALPSELGFTNHQIDFAARTIILDDTNNIQNDAITGVDKPYFWPRPGLSTTNFFRGGDTIGNLTGVLHWSFAGQSGTDAWRIRPVEPAFTYSFTRANERPAAPAVSGSLKVAAYNVLNYFLTIDTTASNDVGICGASQTLDCRGADSAAELSRQREKLTQALLGLDSDVIGLIEMENTPGVEPMEAIVADLNAIAGAGTYSFVNTGVIGSDAIKVGIIYRTAAVSPVGAVAVLDSQAFVNPRNASLDRNRPAVAQTFTETATGARFTVVVNHLKSKGSGCGAGDDDTTTGQGNCNGTRTDAAEELARWIDTDPTGSNDPDFMIIGDLNAYRNEAPITALETAGYTDLIDSFIGASAYSFLFSGQLGYLDHALATASLTAQVVDVDEWHINADESPLLDYNDDIRDPGEASFERESNALDIFAPDAFRTSDHDPVIVGLNLDGVAPITTASVTGATNPLCPSDCFQGSATVALSASDDRSGVVGTQYRLGGSGAFQAYTAPFAITTLGSTLVEFFSVDGAGNVEAVKRVTVKVTDFPSAGVLDAFTRADGRLGANWSGATQRDQYAISGGAVRVGLGGLATWRPTVFGPSQEASMRLTAINATSKHHTLALKARGSGGRDGVILVSYDAAAKAVVVEALVPGQGFRTVASFPATMAAGDLLGARALADGTVQVYVRCELLGTADTRTVAGSRYVNVGGSIGVWFQSASGAAFDDFGGGNR